MSAIGRRYAKALLDLSREEGQLDAVRAMGRLASGGFPVALDLVVGLRQVEFAG